MTARTPGNGIHCSCLHLNCLPRGAKQPPLLHHLCPGAAQLLLDLPMPLCSQGADASRRQSWELRCVPWGTSYLTRRCRT